MEILKYNYLKITQYLNKCTYIPSLATTNVKAMMSNNPQEQKNLHYILILFHIFTKQNKIVSNNRLHVF